MTSGTTASSTGTSTASAVLDRARNFRRVADLSEARLLAEVLAWAELHVTEDPDQAATFGDSPIRLGGEGCPWIREFTITELAAALGMSPAAGRSLVSDVLELAFRLPRLWGKVQSGAVVAWRARAIAAKTQHLSVEAASFVDVQVAEYATRMGRTAIERLVDQAIGRFMPVLAEQQRAAAEDRRHLSIHHDQPSFAGTARIEGEIDLADALDLDAALSRIAEELHDQGNRLPLEQRRAMAAGELARRQFRFRFHYDHHTGTETDGVETSLVEEASREPAPSHPARTVVLYAHLSADAITSHTSSTETSGSSTGGVNGGMNGGVNGGTVVTLEGHGGQLITLDTLRDWLTIDGDTRVTIRPVLDLNARLVSSGRFPTDLQQEQLALRDQTCVAPHCNRRARHLDADHITPWDNPDDHPNDDPDDGGPPGQTESATQTDQTNSDNLAKLCRHHHRAKTFTDWTYTQLYPGVFLWTSPQGQRFLTFQGQTIDLD